MATRAPFKEVEASRPSFDTAASFHYTKTPSPSWTPGSGATSSDWSRIPVVGIDPSAPTRKSVDNYKLLISGVIPRPIGFLSTLGVNGEENLAPMSYTQIVNHDPPIITVGFSGGTGLKDTTRHLLATKECTVNIVSEWFVEAANYCAVDAPTGVSEWDLCGLTKKYDAKKLEHKIARVAESAFVIEAKLLHTHEWKNEQGQHTGTMCILQGVYFHVREDALNEERNMVDPDVLKPVSRLGGITYGRTTQAYELPRPSFKEEVEKWDLVREKKEEAEKREKKNA
ncbi:hypothetical protein EDC01DRAFT_663336 [Geopyxis carbonaria]|nr:hypothetical protein EDC01DRAFT_663336 [Geopyxis carbonaria]